MGESRIVRIGAVGAAALAAAVLLTSCSQLGLGPGTSPEPSVAVVDPSAQPTVATPQTSAPTVASPDPVAPATPTPTPTEADGRAAVEPFITSADLDGTTLDVGAIVPGRVEEGGTCTATAVNGSVTRTVSAGAVPASSYTGCAPLQLTGIDAGRWQVRVRYASDAATGTSAARTVTAG